MSQSLLNQTAVKQYIRDRFERTRPHLGINRVSQQALDDIDAHLRILINRSVHSYPSVGKTFLYCQ